MIPDVSLVAAPMVNQSDFAFRRLIQQHGSTLAYTQMLSANKLLEDQEYLELHLKDLMVDLDFLAVQLPVVQLCGNDPEILVQAGRKVQAYCAGIDLNLGCPQEHAQIGHYGGFLLNKKDWPLIERLVSSMSRSYTVPASAKIRLCQPKEATVDLAKRIEASGASWITLHARTVAPKYRRHGPAALEVVKELKDALSIPVISNGNVRTWDDIQKNLEFTGADGAMVGETLLGNPLYGRSTASTVSHSHDSIFENGTADPLDVSREYLSICREHPGVVPFPIVQAHVRHFVDFARGKRPWFRKFRLSLSKCETFEDIEKLFRKLDRWRGVSLAHSTERVEDLEGLDLAEESNDDAVEGFSDALFTWCGSF